MTLKPAATTKSQKGYWGAALLAAGLLPLLFNLVSIAALLAHLFAGFRSGLIAPLTSLGLALIDAVGSVALGQMDYACVFARILVLFSAMVAIILGIALLRSRASKNAPADPLSSPLGSDREAQ
jgi:hypothetical protein